MMVPIQVIRWYRMQCYGGTDSCATVVPIRRYCHIRPIQNRIVVYLNNVSNKNISKFKNEICNSDKIIFDQLEIEPIEIQKDTIAIDHEISTFSVTNIYLSSQYTCSTTTTAGTTLTATGSVGYRAKLNGHNGFMTASHVLPVLGVTVKVNSKVC